MKKYLVVLVGLLVAATVFAGGTKEQTAPSGQQQQQQQTQTQATQIKNPDTFIEASFGDATTFDVAVSYDTTSATIINNMYEPLITYTKDDISKFDPVLATEVPSTANGGISADGKTYTFHVRQGVKFQNGDPLTAEDVAYTFKRNMVLDPDGGPNWIWYQVFLGGSSSRDGDGKITATWDQINNAVTTKGNDVIFHLDVPFAPFLSVVANGWAVIVDKKFVATNGGWDGTQATWKNFNNPAAGKETLVDKANGTGPYKLNRWEKGTQIVLDRNDTYWGPKPALVHGIYKVVTEWSTRKLMLLQGDADYVTVNPTNYAEMDSEAGIAALRNQPSLNITALLISLNISTKDNPYAGSGQLDGNGVPANFFSDLNMRKGLLYAWDEQTYLKDGTAGFAIDPVVPIPKGLPYRDESIKRPAQNLQTAADYFKKAWSGQAWDKGFKMTLAYNTGNTGREIAAKILAETLGKVNPKFQIDVKGLEWPQYLAAYKAGQLPLFVSGWAPDFPDPDNYVGGAFVASWSAYAGLVGYKNDEIDKLTKEAGVSTDPNVRQKDYYRIQQIFMDEVPDIAISQAIGNYYYKDWLKGMFYNQMQADVFDHLKYFSKGM